MKSLKDTIQRNLTHTFIFLVLEELRSHNKMICDIIIEKKKIKLFKVNYISNVYLLLLIKLSTYIQCTKLYYL